MYTKIKQVIDKMDFDSIGSERKTVLGKLAQFIQKKKDLGQVARLNFICTHNSRRSQFSQVWAQVAAEFYDIPTETYSGGVEVTAFNERAVASLDRFGFKIEKEGHSNPVYTIEWNISCSPLKMFSKLYDDVSNPEAGYAAIVTCAQADESCPAVVGCEERIPVRYNDPKKYDDTPLEVGMYDCRSFEIATEMFYVFSKVK